VKEGGAASSSGAGSSSSASSGLRGVAAVKGLAHRAEKKIASRAATSDVGKKLLREYLDDSAFVCLDALKKIAAKDPEGGGAKKGLWLENTILRLAVKIALLFQHEQLLPRHFVRLQEMIDDMLVDVVRKWNNTRGGARDALDTDHEGLAERVSDLEKDLLRLLSPHISPKNIDAMLEVLAWIKEKQRIERLMHEKAFEPEMKLIAESLAKQYGLSVAESSAAADDESSAAAEVTLNKSHSYHAVI